MLNYKNFATILFGISTMCFLSCANPKKNEGRAEEYSINLVEKNSSLDIVMESDTLETKQEGGLVNFFFKMNDTIKVHENDVRHIYIALGLMPHKDNKTNFTPNDKFTNEIEFSLLKNKSTLEIPFNIIPNFKGKGTIVGFIIDTYELNSYNEEGKTRVITYEHDFSKDVYIK